MNQMVKDKEDNNKNNSFLGLWPMDADKNENF